MKKTWNSQNTPNNSPSRASYGLYIMRIFLLEKWSLYNGTTGNQSNLDEKETHDR